MIKGWLRNKQAVVHIDTDLIQSVIGVIIMAKMRKFINKSLGIALVFWYLTWLGTVLALIFNVRPIQPDTPIIYVAVDIATSLYFAQCCTLLRTQFPKWHNYLCAVLGGWFFGFTYVDLVIPPFSQPNCTLWHVSMFCLCFTTLCTIIYTEFKTVSK
jgi:hypothetical protein